MEWWYIYKAIFWDENENEKSMKCELGMIVADTYVNAMEILQEWYEDDNIDSIQLKVVKEAEQPYLLDQNRFDALWEGRD